jgi:hypothetical protein
VIGVSTAADLISMSHEQPEDEERKDMRAPDGSGEAEQVLTCTFAANL